MGAKLTTTGPGGISTETEGSLSTWAVTEAATPSTVGQQPASTGGVTFSGTRDETDGNHSEFIINNPGTLTHEDDGSGAMGDVLGIVTTANAVGSTISGSMATDLQRLAAVRTAGAVLDLTPTGSWQPEVDLPGLARGIGRDNDGNIHVALSGQATGVDCVYVYDRKGNFVETWATVDTGTDDIGTLYAFGESGGNFYFGMDQSGFKVKVYDSTYTRTLTFGATGSGNNQYQAITDLDVDASGNIYILDASLGRVQKIDSTGAYVTQWVQAGERISVNPAGTRVSVLNNAADLISTYNASGSLQYTYTIPSGDTIVDIAWSSVYFYYTTATETRRLVTPLNDLVPSNVAPFATAAPPGTSTNYLLPGQNEPGGVTLVEGNDLFVWESGTTLGTATVYRSFDWLGATLSQVYEYYFWLIEGVLPVPNFAFTATERNRLVYRGWEDSVWTKLNELASATRTEIVVLSGVRTIRDLASVDQAITSWSQIPAFDVSTLGSAQSLNVVYQGIENDLGLSRLLYDAHSDNNRILSVTAGKVETFTLPIEGTATYVEPPSATDSLADLLNPSLQISYYMISGADDLPVVAAQWSSYGGSLTAVAADATGITVTLTGPTEEIPGVPGPYKVAVSDGSSSYATLRLWGSGVVGEPKTLVRHTGADPEKVTQESANTITNYFVNTKTDAYEASTWAASYAGGPAAMLNGALPLQDCTGFGVTPGARIEDSQAKWRIGTTSITNTTLGLTTLAHTTNQDLVDIWGALGTLTNYVTNTSFETGTTGYTASSSTTLTQSATWAEYGSNSGRLSTTSSDGRFSIGSASVGAGIAWGLTPGETYTVSGYIHSVFPGGGSWLTEAGVILVEYANATNNNIFLGKSDPLAALTADARPSVTFTLPADATGLRFSFYATGIGTNWFAYWDGLMVTEGDLLLDFFDGANGGTWTGAANASTSTRPSGNAGDLAALWAGHPCENFKMRPLRVPSE